MKTIYQHNGRAYSITLEPQPDGSYHALIGDQTYSVQASVLPDGGWQLNIDGARHTVYSAAEGKRRYVQVIGQSALTLTVAEVESARRRTSAGAGSGILLAQMPGQVVEVYVAPGDSVTAGQTLLVLEAMKMEIRLSAAANGVVKQVLVSKGSLVERDQPLVEISSAPHTGL
ncbi:MAG: biotin/lipoyl-binding protein [Armatimonadetes bacterium]|nr:biotin/lipoyl-binding protein [Anaerolineae bacterium]